MKKAPPPPTSQAPVSKEVVEIVKKKKLGQPLGPPPAGMAGFKAPKLYSPQKNSAPSHDESSMNYSSDDEDAKHMLTQSRTLSGRDRDQSLQSESKTKASPKRFPAKGSDDNIDSNSSRPTTGAPVVAPSKNEAANKTIFNFRSVLQSTYRELR